MRDCASGTPSPLRTSTASGPVSLMRQTHSAMRLQGGMSALPTARPDTDREVLSERWWTESALLQRPC
jgi:hypothetical protein